MKCRNKQLSAFKYTFKALKELDRLTSIQCKSIENQDPVLNCMTVTMVTMKTMELYELLIKYINESLNPKLKITLNGTTICAETDESRIRDIFHCLPKKIKVLSLSNYEKRVISNILYKNESHMFEPLVKILYEQIRPLEGMYYAYDMSEETSLLNYIFINNNIKFLKKLCKTMNQIPNIPIELLPENR